MEIDCSASNWVESHPSHRWGQIMTPLVVRDCLSSREPPPITTKCWLACDRNMSFGRTDGRRWPPASERGWIESKHRRWLTRSKSIEWAKSFQQWPWRWVLFRVKCINLIINMALWIWRYAFDARKLKVYISGWHWPSILENREL